MAGTSKPALGFPQLEAGSVFAGYRIESVIDRGGMGVVFKAVDPDLERTVALKVIAPEYTQDQTAVARFKAECRLAASLEHPNIVPIHRGGEFEGVLYLAMRFVPGTNLRTIVDQGPMELPRLDRIIGQVAAALDAAHERGLVHRDVKPANILIAGQGDDEHVYLTDFGLTKRLGSADALTRAGGWVGTPDYVAPEQIQGRPVDRRADVYSLGCVLFEMLTGRVAYARDSDMAKLWAHVSDPPPLPRTVRPQLPALFDDIVARATAKDPSDRFATAGALADEVHKVVAADADPLKVRSERSDPPSAIGATHDETLVGASAVAEPPPPPPPTREPAVAAASPPPSAPPPPRTHDPAAPRAAAEPPRRGTRRNGSRGGGGSSKRSWLIAGGVVAAAAVIALVVVLASGGGSSSSSKGGTAAPKPPAGQRVSGALGPVPTNRVNGNGKVIMRLNGRSLKVTVNTSHLLNGAPHALHIHAGGKGTCPPASAASLHNGHLSLATHQGVPFYGPAVTALTTRGNTSPEHSLVAFARYPTASNVEYRRTIRVSRVVASYLRQNNAVVIVHGIDYNHNGIYDGVLERSDLDRSLTGESTAPALCGPVIAQKKGAGTKTAQAAPGGRGTVYVAALSAQPSTPAQLICPLHDVALGDVRPT